MGVSIQSANSVLKVRYARDLTRILMTDPMNEPFIALAARKKGKMVKSAVGQVFHVPIKTRDQQTANFSFTKAQGKSDGANGASNYVGFDVPVVFGYATGRVDGQAQCVADGDDNAFVDLLDEETQGALRQAQSEIAAHTFRNGTGSRGKIGSLNASSVTLSAAADTVWFELDMTIGANVADGTGAMRATGPFVITSIDPVTGKLGLSGDPTAGGGAAWQAGDFLYVDGDFLASTKTKVVGLDAWIPTAVPTGAVTFNGVVRDSNWKLYGLRHDASTSADTKTAFIDATAKIRQFAKGKTTHGFMNPLDWGKLAGQFEATRHTYVKDEEYNLSFASIKVSGMTGEFNLLADANVPKGRAYLLNMEHVYFIHTGDDLAYIAQEDGNVVLRKGDADAYEVRCRSGANLVIDDPSQQCVIYGIT